MTRDQFHTLKQNYYAKFCSSDSKDTKWEIDKVSIAVNYVVMIYSWKTVIFSYFPKWLGIRIIPCYNLGCNIVQSSLTNLKLVWMRLFSTLYTLIYIYISFIYVQKLERYDGERWKHNIKGQNLSVQTVRDMYIFVLLFIWNYKKGAIFSCLLTFLLDCFWLKFVRDLTLLVSGTITFKTCHYLSEITG